MKINKIFILFTCFFAAIVFGGIYYVNNVVNNLQNQINERDSLLEKSLIAEDSLRSDNTSLIESLNKLFKDGSFIEDGKFDVVKFINKYNSLQDTIDQLKTNLEMVTENYGVSHSITRRKIGNSTVKTTSLRGTEKIDSGLLLLPFFRERLTIKDDGSYVVDLDGARGSGLRESKILLQKQYNELVKDYNGLLKKRNADKDFYDNILKKLAKKGTIKIDTLDDGTTEYTY